MIFRKALSQWRWVQQQPIGLKNKLRFMLLPSKERFQIQCYFDWCQQMCKDALRDIENHTLTIGKIEGYLKHLPSKREDNSDIWFNILADMCDECRQALLFIQQEKL